MLQFEVSEDLAGLRADFTLAKLSANILTRSMAIKLIDQDRVMLGGQKLTSKSTKLKAGDLLSVDYNPNLSAKNEEIEVIFEDDDLMVINKPAGILSHAKGKLDQESTVADWAQPHTTNLPPERSGIVHRLDRATSGVMILAKNPTSKSWLMKQFADRNVHKKYLAIISGAPEDLKFNIDLPIARNAKKPTTFHINANGKEAQTEVEVLASVNQGTKSALSLVLLSPHTGRTHQLRVHMWANGWPIVGDPFYGSEPNPTKTNSNPAQPNLMLHALSLEIQTSPNAWQTFVAQPPKKFMLKLKEVGLPLPPKK